MSEKQYLVLPQALADEDGTTYQVKATGVIN